MKTGRLSTKEWKYIEKNAKILSAETMAAKLNRSVESVERYLKKVGLSANKKESFELQAEYDIKGRPYWKELKLQFNDEELDLFLYHWKQVIAQFRKDVLATEELQVVDLIKLEILMNRALREQHQSALRVSELERELEADKRATPTPAPEDRERFFNIEKQIASLRAAKEALSREFKELQAKKSGLYKDLKATREQRIEKLENNKQTFSGLVNKILRDPDFFEQEGKALEKMRLAVEEERKRLSALHTYDDGGLDHPFLTPATVLERDTEDA